MNESELEKGTMRYYALYAKVALRTINTAINENHEWIRLETGSLEQEEKMWENSHPELFDMYQLKAAELQDKLFTHIRYRFEAHPPSSLEAIDEILSEVLSSAVHEEWKRLPRVHSDNVADSLLKSWLLKNMVAY